MKKLTFILLIVFGFNLASNAQGGVQINFDQLKKKVEKSSADIENPKKNIKEGVWIDRADLMMEIFDSHLYNNNLGTELGSFNLIMMGNIKNSVQEEIEGVLVEKKITERTIFYFIDGKLERYEILNPVVENPLDIAFDMLKKAQEIDVAGKKNKKIAEEYNQLKQQYIANGSNCYSFKNYECAYKSFLKVITIGELPLINKKDTAIYYYAALSAQLAGKNQEAVDLYKKAIELNFTADGNAYNYIDQAYKALGDNETGLKYLEEGFAKHPKNQMVLLSLINYYLNKNEDPSKVVIYLDKAIQDDPKNPSLYHAKGSVYDKINDFDNALNSYKKAIEIDPKFYDSYYNLGVLYYNRAVKFIEEANKIPAKEIEKYDATIANANVEFKNSLPYFEKAFELNSGDKFTAETLKNIYFRYRNESPEMKAKYDDIMIKLENIK